MPDHAHATAGATIRTTARLVKTTEDAVRQSILRGDYKTHVEDGETLVDLPSLQRIYDVAKDGNAALASQMTTLDTKASFVLGSASLLATGLAAFQGGLSTFVGERMVCAPDGDSCFALSAQTIVHGITLLAACIYAFVVYCAWRAYKPRAYVVLDPRPVQGYVTNADDATQVALLQALLALYDANVAAVEEKATWTRWAARAFLIEVVFLTCTLVLTAIV